MPRLYIIADSTLFFGYDQEFTHSGLSEVPLHTGWRSTDVEALHLLFEGRVTAFLGCSGEWQFSQYFHGLPPGSCVLLLGGWNIKTMKSAVSEAREMERLALTKDLKVMRAKLHVDQKVECIEEIWQEEFPSARVFDVDRVLESLPGLDYRKEDRWGRLRRPWYQQPDGQQVWGDRLHKSWNPEAAQHLLQLVEEGIFPS